MLKGQEITVLGAGIGGLAVSYALARRGAKVRVLEQAPGLHEVGAGLQISPNGARVLEDFGMGGALADASVRGEAVSLIDGESNDIVARLDLLRLRAGDAYRFIHRADLVGLLSEAARDAGVTFEFNQHVEEVILGDHAPMIRLVRGGERQVDILVGADGLHSKTREALNGHLVPFFTHQVAWRATLPAEPDIAPEARVYLGRGKHLVTYPLRDGRLRNIVAVEERRRWAEESWSLTDDPMTMRVAFEDFAPEVRGWLDQIEQPNLWGLFRHPVAARWSGQGAVILGDAAHPTLPFLAQGANMALEDAWVLADALAADPVPVALHNYQHRREERVKRIVDAATANARNYHLSGLRRGIGHLGLRALSALAPDTLLSRFDWLYGYDVTKTGQA